MRVHVSPVQVVSVSSVRLVLTALQERVVVGGIRVSPVQVVSVANVCLILIALAERVVVAASAKMAPVFLFHQA